MTPETITITATFTYPKADIEAFADRRGYQEQVLNPAYKETLDPDTGEITTNGEPKFITNPQTREDFVKVWFKEEAKKILGIDIIAAAEKAAEETKKQVVESEMAKLDAAISIT